MGILGNVAPQGTVICHKPGKTLDEDGKRKKNERTGFILVTGETRSTCTGELKLGLNSDPPEGRTSILVGLWTGDD